MMVRAIYLRYSIHKSLIMFLTVVRNYTKGQIIKSKLNPEGTTTSILQHHTHRFF